MFSNNTIKDNREYGFLLSFSNENILSENQILNNGFGIGLSTSEGSKISANTIDSNRISGIFISSTSNNNAIFNNYLNNLYDIDVKEGGIGNVFNTTKSPGPNIVGGPDIGGNFWAKPDGTGFSQTAPDSDGDGIADTVYSFSGNVSTDFLPLVKGSGSSQSVTPATGSNANGTSTSNVNTNKTKATSTQQTSNETQQTSSETQSVTDETQSSNSEI